MNTTGGAITLTLPGSPTLGDEISFVDYAGTFDTNNLTVARNGKKINGSDIRTVLEQLINNKPISSNQTPSIGCNIKWK